MFWMQVFAGDEYSHKTTAAPLYLLVCMSAILCLGGTTHLSLFHRCSAEF